MSRWIVPSHAGLIAPGQAADDVIARVVKYVPGEIVGAYTMVFTALVSLSIPQGYGPSAAFVLIAVFFAATVFYVARGTSGGVRRAHLLVSPLAFLAWAYPISSAILDQYFVPVLALALQALVIVLSIFIVPQD